MNEPVELIGGARIGLFTLSWPFAKLIVDKNKIMLNASIAGNYIFFHQDVRIEKIDFGIMFHHNIPHYPSSIVFLTNKAESILNQITELSFTVKENTIKGNEIELLRIMQQRSPYPFNKKFLTLIIICLIILLIIQIMFDKKLGNKNLCISFISMVSFVILFFNQASKYAFNPDRSVKDVSTVLYFIFFITLILTCIQ